MSLLSAIVIGLALGYAIGGRPANLARIDLRWNLLIFLSLAVQLVLFTGLSLPAGLVTVAYVASGLLSIAWLMRNVRLPGVGGILLGGLSNFVAIAANGGRMPIEPAVLATARGADFVRALAAGQVTSNSSLADSHTRFRWLIDQFVIPPPWPLPTALSIGDLLIAAGVVWLIAAGMRRTEKPRASSALAA